MTEFVYLKSKVTVTKYRYKIPSPLQAFSVGASWFPRSSSDTKGDALSAILSLPTTSCNGTGLALSALLCSLPFLLLSVKKLHQETPFNEGKIMQNSVIMDDRNKVKNPIS